MEDALGRGLGGPQRGQRGGGGAGAVGGIHDGEGGQKERCQRAVFYAPVTHHPGISHGAAAGGRSRAGPKQRVASQQHQLPSLDDKQWLR